LAVREAQRADLALDGDARVVRNLLARTGEQVEERGLAAVRIADQRHAPRRRVIRRVQRVRHAVGSVCATRVSLAAGMLAGTASGSRPPGPRRSNCTGSPGMKPISARRRSATASTSGEADTTRATIARAPSGS